MSKLYRFVLAESLKRAAASLKLSLAPEGERVLAETLPSFPVFPDVRPALTALKAQGWNLALLSNSDRELIAQTISTIPVAIDLVITAEEALSYKPGLAQLLRFQDTTAATEGNWVHVAMWLAIMTRLGVSDRSVTTEMKTNFLHAARQEPFLCTATILKLGKRLIYGVAECVNSCGTLLTHHTITYMRPES